MHLSRHLDVYFIFDFSFILFVFFFWGGTLVGGLMKGTSQEHRKPLMSGVQRQSPVQQPAWVYVKLGNGPQPLDAPSLNQDAHTVDGCEIHFAPPKKPWKDWIPL